MGFWEKLFGRRDERALPEEALPPPLPPHEAQAQSAERWLEEAQSQSALTDPLFLGTIDSLIATGREIRAMSLLRKALVRFPNHSLSLLRLAEIAIERRDLNVARPALETCAQSGSQEERARAYFLLGELAEDEGLKAEARAHYESVLALNFHYPLARDRARRLAEELGQDTTHQTRATMTQSSFGDGKLGRFSLLRELGRGASGAVYLAADGLLERQIALKILHPQLSSKERERSRFFDEARAAARLRHPGVVRVYDLDESIFGIAMEFLPGGTLKERISRSLPTRAALSICKELATILTFIHERGLIHRDLKPANLLFAASGPEGGGGRLVLTDFGVAHLGGEPNDEVVGTFAYMSPEQRLGKELSAKTDLYALGVILYECLSGQTPLTPEQIARGTHSINLEPALSRVRPGLVPRLRAILLSLLAPNPENRVQRAKVIEKELKQLIALIDLGEDAQNVFTDAIWVAKTKTPLASGAKLSLVQAAKALGISSEKAASLARKEGISPNDIADLAADIRKT